MVCCVCAYVKLFRGAFYKTSYLYAKKVIHGMIYLEGQVNCKRLCESWKEDVQHQRLVHFLNHGHMDVNAVNTRRVEHLLPLALQHKQNRMDRLHDYLLLSIDPLSGDVIDRISTVGIYPGYIAAVDDRLLVYDLRSFSFLDYDPASGESIPLFQVTGIEMGGMTVHQGNILFTDTNSNSVYVYSFEGEMLNFYRSPASSTTGIAVDDAQNIYLFTLDGQLYKVSIP